VNQFPVINGRIYVIASYDFIVNRPLCCVINQQHLQWVASESSLHITQIVLLCGAPDSIGAHRIKRAHNFYFILFVSGGICMFDRLNSLVCNDIFKLPVVTSGRWRLRHSGGIVKEWNTAW